MVKPEALLIRNIHRSAQILHGPSGIVLLIGNTLGYLWKKTSKMRLTEVLKHGTTRLRSPFERLIMVI